jgi:starch synthase
MRILQVASEAVPLVKTGGLADVVTALSTALLRAGDDTSLLLPAYPEARERANARPRIDLGDPLGCGPTRLWSGKLPGTDVEVWLVECDPLYARKGGPYVGPDGHDHPDNHLRFGLLARVAAMLGGFGMLAGLPIDVVHVHDWQAALAPAYLAWWGGPRPATVLTVHNLHFAGRFVPSVIPALAIPPSSFSMHGVEFFGDVSFLKAGLYHADRITTVSPTYALEICTPEGGEGFDGLLRARAPDLHGILNGIDTAMWDPATDPHLPAKFDSDDLALKDHVKLALQAELGLTLDAGAPLFGLVGRLAWQKGIDLVHGVVPRLLARGGQLVVLGSGDPALEAALARTAEQHPGRIAYRWGYDEPLAHRIVAGADMFLMPSRYEPCGLTQLYAMRYGTAPVVRRTGGLADTVIDIDEDPASGTGVLFDPPTVLALGNAIERAITTWIDKPRWRELQRRGMAQDFGWERGAADYRAVYRSARPGVP